MASFFNIVCNITVKVKVYSALLTCCLCPSDAPNAMDVWRHNHAWTDREKTYPLHGNSLQTTSTTSETARKAPTTTRQERGQAPRSESVQAGQFISPPELGEKQRGQKGPSSSLPYADNCVLGHSHLTRMTHSQFPPILSPTHPLPHSNALCCFFPATSGVSEQLTRALEGAVFADVKDNGGYHSNISTLSGCHVFLSSLVIFDIFLFPMIGFL